MKKTIIFILCCLLVQIGNAQKADFVNAPSNPYGFKFHKDQYRLKGDIYASGEKTFDHNGNVIMSYGTEYYYKNGKLVGNNYGDTYITDARGNVVEVRFSSGKSTYYTFNDKNLLVKEENIYDEVYAHAYDSKGRILATVVHKKGELYSQRDYSYKKKRNVLEVTIKNTNPSKSNQFDSSYHYKDGHLIKEVLSSGSYDYTVVIDHNGNKIDFYDKNKDDANHFRTYNRYYDEKDKSSKLEFGYYKSSFSALSMPSMYANGERMQDIKWSKGIHPNEEIAYDGLKNIYYSVSNVEELKKDTSKRIPVTKIIARNMPNITYSFDGNFIVYIKGRSGVKKRDFAFMGPHLVDYRIEKTVRRTYMVDNYKGKTAEVKELKLLSVDKTNVLYYRDLEKDNFLITVDGKHVDYKIARMEYLRNGDIVVFVNDKPLYVLNGFKEAIDKKVYFGAFYNGELDLKENKVIVDNKTTSTAEKKSTDFDCVKGDCKEGWGRVETNDIITDATFKKGVIEGLAYISYPSGSYFHGQYIKNRRDGVGYYKWATGSVYIGNWKEGKQHGLGYTMDKDNKITSGGMFENGKLITESTTEYREGKSVGKCVGNCAEGFGKFSYTNGDIYWGFFKGGERYGIGTYLWNNKSSYTGAYTKGGKRNGYGIFTYEDGSVFKGIFIDDRINGLGVMKYKKTGDIVQGVFNNNGAKIKDY